MLAEAKLSREIFPGRRPPGPPGPGGAETPTPASPCPTPAGSGRELSLGPWSALRAARGRASFAEVRRGARHGREIAAREPPGRGTRAHSETARPPWPRLQRTLECGRPGEPEEQSQLRLRLHSSPWTGGQDPPLGNALDGRTGRRAVPSSLFPPGRGEVQGDRIWKFCGGAPMSLSPGGGGRRPPSSLFPPSGGRSGGGSRPRVTPPPSFPPSRGEERRRHGPPPCSAIESGPQRGLLTPPHFQGRGVKTDSQLRLPWGRPGGGVTRLHRPTRRGELDGGNGGPPAAGRARVPARDPPPDLPPEGGRSSGQSHLKTGDALCEPIPRQIGQNEQGFGIFAVMFGLCLP